MDGAWSANRDPPSGGEQTNQVRERKSGKHPRLSAGNLLRLGDVAESLSSLVVLAHPDTGEDFQLVIRTHRLSPSCVFKGALIWLPLLRYARP